MYAQLLADARSIAPTRSKIDDDDDEFEPATRPASLRPASPRSRPLSIVEYARLAGDDGDAASAGHRDSGRPLSAWGFASAHMQEEQRRSTSGPHGGLASWSVSGLSAPPSPGVRTPGAGDGSWPASPRAARAPGAVTMRGAQDEVAAYANGTWGFAYPTKDSLAPLGLCEQDGDGEHGQGRQLEEGG